MNHVLSLQAMSLETPDAATPVGSRLSITCSTVSNNCAEQTTDHYF